jgi:hypothetical protein
MRAWVDYRWQQCLFCYYDTRLSWVVIKIVDLSSSAFVQAVLLVLYLDTMVFM